jgi:hypothetical protein
MKYVILFSVLLTLPLTVQAKDDEYTVTVRKILKAEKTIGDVFNACIEQTGTTPVDLDKEDVPANVKKSFKAASDKDARGVYTLQMGPHMIYMVDAVSEGNGCCNFFTKKGSALASFCGTESSEWRFKD